MLCLNDFDMVDNITKALNKLSDKDRDEMKGILTLLKKGALQHLDIKKLKGRSDIYRVRKGNMRLLFHKREDGMQIVSVERRSDNTY